MRWSIAPTVEFVGVWIPSGFAQTASRLREWMRWSIAPTDEFLGVWTCTCSFARAVLFLISLRE
jgi:hypothetical protein